MSHYNVSAASLQQQLFNMITPSPSDSQMDSSPQNYNSTIYYHFYLMLFQTNLTFFFLMWKILWEMYFLNIQWKSKNRGIHTGLKLT